MGTVRIDQNAEVTFPVSSAGALVTGLAPGVFTVTVVAPDGSTLLAPAPSVAELGGKAGVYTCTVPALFFTTNGAGTYEVVIEVSAPAGVIQRELVVVDEERKVEVSVTFDAAANTIRCNSWLVGPRGIDAGVADATIRLYDQAGTALVAQVDAAAADAQGVFSFDIPAPSFAVGETETYFVATIDGAGPPLRTYSGRVGATFSRTS
jgi:hypothetical protein